MKISEVIKEYFVLEFLAHELKIRFDLNVTLGVELEFYIIKQKGNGNIITYEDLIETLEKKYNIKIKSESGKNQFEISLKPSSRISEYALYIENIKKKLIDFSEKQGYRILFCAKPFKNDYGNAMQVNVSFNDFHKKVKLITDILCSYVGITKNFYISRKDYIRLDSKFMSPTHVCCGAHFNRTVMIRILKNRIEHRLPSSNSNAYNVFYAILFSLLDGLINLESKFIKNFPIIYGNAFDTQYMLEKI